MLTGISVNKNKKNNVIYIYLTQGLIQKNQIPFALTKLK